MIRSSGFVFSAMGADVVSVTIDKGGDIQVDLHLEDVFFMTPAEARELAEALFQLAAEVDPTVPAGEVPVGGDFHFADEPRQAVYFQSEEPVQEKLQRILDAAAGNRFDVI